MRPSGDLIFGTLIRLVILYAAAMAFLIYWPVGVGLLMLAIFMPWPDTPDWVTPEKNETPEPEPEPEPPATKEPFWLWDR